MRCVWKKLAIPVHLQREASPISTQVMSDDDSSSTEDADIVVTEYFSDEELTEQDKRCVCVVLKAVNSPFNLVVLIVKRMWRKMTLERFVLETVGCTDNITEISSDILLQSNTHTACSVCTRGPKESLWEEHSHDHSWIQTGIYTCS